MKNKIGYLSILFIVMMGCGKKNNPIPSPAKAALAFPLQNSACTTGDVLSETENVVTFTWSAAENTNIYELNVKNLLTNVSVAYQSTNTALPVNLLRNTPYSWYVVSKSTFTDNIAHSDTWSFYNSGPGVTSHPPLPANLTAPKYGQTVTTTGNTVSLTWLGGDVDNDIVGYDVYFGTTATPALLNANVVDVFLNGVPTTSNTTYYWKVITKDAQGNTSDSGVFMFKTN